MNWFACCCIYSPLLLKIAAVYYSVSSIPKWRIIVVLTCLLLFKKFGMTENRLFQCCFIQARYCRPHCRRRTIKHNLDVLDIGFVRRTTAIISLRLYSYWAVHQLHLQVLGIMELGQNIFRTVNRRTPSTTPRSRCIPQACIFMARVLSTRRDCSRVNELFYV